MNFAVNEKSTREVYDWMTRLITPRPIAWVSTLSVDGIANLAPFSFFCGVGANPPTLAFCPANRRDGTPKDSLLNVQRTGQFVINIVTESVAESMNRTAAELPPGEDEFEFADVAKAVSTLVRPPRVASAVASMECELHSAIAIGSGPGGANLVLGRIVWIHVQDDCVDHNGSAITERLDTIGRMAGDQYSRTADRFVIARPKT
ncbi:Flavin reductase like domain protein [Rubripirellula tenax]|uniref:Flavin reductase like domain protein n=1 Tax=Rubripirellula tenax TaxID=2528015 RepID=A0A5C6EG43_9BACT|nr:flavin reductase family protein [Rubripirellula tenax]TWU48753.1 Flavin reductase like domain protein [Rubripirellula tenax]